MQANAYFGMAGIKLDSMDIPSQDLARIALKRFEAISDAKSTAVRVIMVTGRAGGSADADPVIAHEKISKRGLAKDLKSSGVALTTPSGTPLAARGTRSLRATNTSLGLVTAPVQHPRATRVICTLGPACWSEQGLAALLDAGCDVVRFNFSHGDHAGAGSSHLWCSLWAEGGEWRTVMAVWLGVQSRWCWRLLRVAKLLY